MPALVACSNHSGRLRWTCVDRDRKVLRVGASFGIIESPYDLHNIKWLPAGFFWNRQMNRS